MAIYEKSQNEIILAKNTAPSTRSKCDRVDGALNFAIYLSFLCDTIRKGKLAVRRW